MKTLICFSNCFTDHHTYPTFELNSSCCDVFVVVVVHHKSVRLSHNELTTLFQRRRTFFSEFSTSQIFGLDGIRTFSSVDLLLMLLLFKLLRSIELLVGRITGIFDRETIAFSIVFVSIKLCIVTFNNHKLDSKPEMKKNRIGDHITGVDNFVHTPVHACILTFNQKKNSWMVDLSDVFQSVDIY
jgi:hypothetical protein